MYGVPGVGDGQRLVTHNSRAAFPRAADRADPVTVSGVVRGMASANVSYDLWSGMTISRGPVNRSRVGRGAILVAGIGSTSSQGGDHGHINFASLGLWQRRVVACLRRHVFPFA